MTTCFVGEMSSAKPRYESAPSAAGERPCTTRRWPGNVELVRVADVRKDDVDFLGFGARGMIDVSWRTESRAEAIGASASTTGASGRTGFPEQVHIVSNFGSTSEEMKKNVTRLISAAGAGIPSIFTATNA